MREALPRANRDEAPRPAPTEATRRWPSLLQQIVEVAPSAAE